MDLTLSFANLRVSLTEQISPQLQASILEFDVSAPVNIVTLNDGRNCAEDAGFTDEGSECNIFSKWPRDSKYLE